MYYAQTLLIGATVLALFWRDGRLTRLHVVAWVALVAVLFRRYGADEQLLFYSNDQRIYSSVVVAITDIGVPLQPSWWLSFSKPVYTIPAALLHFAGIDPGLALKTVSLVSLLLLIRFVQRELADRDVHFGLATAYLTALGPIALLYSSLALRETTMMLLATVVVWGRRVDVRGWSLIALTTLRPHLAAALAIGLALAWLLREPRHHLRVAGASLRIVGGVLLGYLSFGVGSALLNGGIFPKYEHKWGIDPVLRVGSNFLGLQFLTAAEDTRELSLGNLALSRIALSETIVIPLLFTIGIVVAFRNPQRRHVAVVVAFAFYVGLVTLTEFNSFRQNIPFMPSFGMLVVLAWQARRTALRRATELVGTSG